MRLVDPYAKARPLAPDPGAPDPFGEARFSRRTFPFFVAVGLTCLLVPAFGLLAIALVDPEIPSWRDLSQGGLAPDQQRTADTASYVDGREGPAPSNGTEPSKIVDFGTENAGVSPIDVREEPVATAASTESEGEHTDLDPSAAETPIIRYTLTVSPGQSIFGILRSHEIPPSIAITATEGLSPPFDPSKLQVGDKIMIVLDSPQRSEADVVPPRLLALSLQPRRNPRRQHLWHGEDYAAREVIEIVDGLADLVPAAVTKTSFVAGEIRRSLSQAASQAGLTRAETARVAKILAGSVDFRRDIRKGDTFESLIERREGEPTIIHYVGLRNGARSFRFYRATFSDGSSGYFDRKGASHLSALTVRPLGAARVTSGFGTRIHPVHGGRHFHPGIDFRARPGTPIPAAGHGVVVVKGWRGGYGRYLRIRHAGGYMTAYAHLKAFSDEIRVGARIKQGQVIGYVGSSGVSTGPHLHFEVFRDGKQVNPLTLPKVSTPTLNGKRLEAFQTLVASVDEDLAAARAAMQDTSPVAVASAE